MHIGFYSLQRATHAGSKGILHFYLQHVEVVGTHIVYTLYAEWFFAFGIQFDIGVLCGMQRRSGSTVCTCQFIRVV